MSHELWSAVDHYLIEKLIPADPALDAALRNNAEAGLPAIDVAPNQGKLLYLLARLTGARKILEVGTLGGYSTTWLARALPADGHLITLELEPKHAAVARQNLEAARVGDRVEIRVGPALDSLRALEGSFDLIFVDADKASLPYYLPEAIRLSRSGTLILVDNVVRDGAVIEADSDDPNVQGVRSMFNQLVGDDRLEATALQTVGSKGYDGLMVARVR